MFPSVLRKTDGVPNKPMVLTATNMLDEYAPVSGRQHIGKSLGESIDPAGFNKITCGIRMEFMPTGTSHDFRGVLA